MPTDAGPRWTAGSFICRPRPAGTLYQTALRYEPRQFGLRFLLRPNGPRPRITPLIIRAFGRADWVA